MDKFDTAVDEKIARFFGKGQVGWKELGNEFLHSCYNRRESA